MKEDQTKYSGLGSPAPHDMHNFIMDNIVFNVKLTLNKKYFIKSESALSVGIDALIPDLIICDRKNKEELVIIEVQTKTTRASLIEGKVLRMFQLNSFVKEVFYIMYDPDKGDMDKPEIVKCFKYVYDESNDSIIDVEDKPYFSDVLKKDVRKFTSMP